MIHLVAIKSDRNIEEGHTYSLGGLVQNTNNAVLMDKEGRKIIPGDYDVEEVFGISKEKLIRRIKSD